jgi:pimeloyl-ACP methyl ester carboxylesterase
VQGQRESITSPDGVEIGLITDGAGPRLLLVHGGMASSARWAPLWPLLTQRYRVTAMDRRGRGMSGDIAEYRLAKEYDDVVAVADHLVGQEQAGIDVFAHSYGAVCAMGAASKGARFRRLALYEPPGPQTAPREWIDRATAMMTAGQVGRAMVSFLVEIIGLDQATITAMRDSPTARESIPIATTTLAREAEALASVDLTEVARSITGPVLLLLGERSPQWATTITHALAHSLPAATVAGLPGLGHDAFDTAPGLLAAELDRFFDRTI